MTNSKLEQCTITKQSQLKHCRIVKCNAGKYMLQNWSCQFFQNRKSICGKCKTTKLRINKWEIKVAHLRNYILLNMINYVFILNWKTENEQFANSNNVTCPIMQTTNIVSKIKKRLFWTFESCKMDEMPHCGFATSIF